ncbi:hypothetical protein B0H17DRAFT_1145786 [Mycena rosella]|uniref:Uncharacterized protein n=1 Tax=Mycena rosella TaxID=1033263 RepID=A0AAD7CQA6_MYCRO|nr:hypothetical protein B0H17DRAFT_1145786 [Mycena rosella]
MNTTFGPSFADFVGTEMVFKTAARTGMARDFMRGVYNGSSGALDAIQTVHILGRGHRQALQASEQVGTLGIVFGIVSRVQRRMSSELEGKMFFLASKGGWDDRGIHYA